MKILDILFSLLIALPITAIATTSYIYISKYKFKRAELILTLIFILIFAVLSYKFKIFMFLFTSMITGIFMLIFSGKILHWVNLLPHQDIIIEYIINVFDKCKILSFFLKVHSIFFKQITNKQFILYSIIIYLGSLIYMIMLRAKLFSLFLFDIALIENNPYFMTFLILALYLHILRLIISLSLIITKYTQNLPLAKDSRYILLIGTEDIPPESGSGGGSSNSNYNNKGPQKIINYYGHPRYRPTAWAVGSACIGLCMLGIGALDVYAQFEQIKESRASREESRLARRVGITCSLHSR